MLKELNIVITMDKYQILIDIREIKIKEYFQHFEHVIIKALDIGDIQFKYNQEMVLLIERKTIMDLSSSIKDGRHREQKARLLESGIDNHKILYLIEGNMNENKVGCLPKKTMVSSLINTLIRDKLNIYRTMNIEDTIFFLEMIYHKLLKEGDKLINGSGNNKDYISTIKMKKKDNLTPSNCFILQLAQIPGSSVKIANRVIQDYKTMYDLCHQYTKLDSVLDCELLLANLSYNIQNDKQRRIGNVVSSRIYKYLTGNKQDNKFDL